MKEGVAGAKIEILDINGDVVKDADGSDITSVTTSADGSYQFCGLVPATYKVKVTPPEGHYLSPVDEGSDDSSDSDIDPTTLFSPTTTLISGDNNTTFDAGVFKPACIGDKVWVR